MNKFKVGDVVVCINNKNLYGLTPKLTVGKSYKVIELNEETDIIIVNDTGSKESFNTMRFKLAEGENMYKIDKAEAQAKINEIKKELAKLEEIVNAPDGPKFKPFTVEISDPKVALYLFTHLGNRPYKGDTSDFYNQIRDEFEEQSGQIYTELIINWLKSQS